MKDSTASDDVGAVDAHLVVDEYEKFGRGLGWLVAIGLTMYLLTWGMLSFISWNWNRDPEQFNIAPNLSATLSLSVGFSALALLAALAIALHLVSWGIRPDGVLKNLAHARRKYLAQAAEIVGLIAIIVGAAMILEGAPSDLNLAGFLSTIASAGVVAVIANDAALVLREHPHFNAEIADESRDRDITALKAVAVRWQSSRPWSLRSTTKDLIYLVAATALFPAILWTGALVFGATGVRPLLLALGGFVALPDRECVTLVR